MHLNNFPTFNYGRKRVGLVAREEGGNKYNDSFKDLPVLQRKGN